MAVSTIGPGKDFATLQGWYDTFAGGGGTQEAECYAGADLGGLSITSPDDWVIYVAPGNHHNGTDNGTTGVAYSAGAIDITGPLVSIDGLRLQNHVEYTVPTTDPATWTLKNCLIVQDVSGSGNPVSLLAADSGGNDVTAHAVFINNIILWNRNAITSASLLINTDSSDTGEVTVVAELYNNTIIRGNGTLGAGISFVELGGANVSAIVVNNIVLGATVDYASSGTITFATASNNLSSDATADDWGPVGAKINQTPSSVVVDPVSNPTLKTTSQARDTGATVAAASPDAIGVIRPQGPAYDMGALELVIASGRTRRPHVFRFWRH